MSALGSIWSYPTFRDAVRDLLELNPDKLLALRDLTRHGFDLEPEDVAQHLGITTGSASAVLSVTLSLYSVARREDLTGEDVAEELILRAGQHEDFHDLDLQEKKDHISALFEADAQIDRAMVRRSAEGAYFPEVQSVQLGLDLRVLRGEHVDDESSMRGRLVPVVVGRIVFDEPVAGSDRIAFQLPPSMLAEIAERMDEVENRLAVIESDLSEWLYPESR